MEREKGEDMKRRVLELGIEAGVKNFLGKEEKRHSLSSLS